jgi:hypothetical protein
MTETATIRLLDSVLCPHCWVRFAPVDLRFIAESPALLGDPRLGEGEPLRFAPSRFDGSGAAIDPEGGKCRRTACPRCHSEFPRVGMELPSLPISIVGAPGAGKSAMLASMAWSARRDAPRLGASFSDSEPRFNRSLHLDEHALFGGGGTLPDKTETGGDRHYRISIVDGREETLPRPLVFTWHRRSEGRLVVLYDNAGEHYLPGADGHAVAATRHLAHCRTAILVLDPLQDRRFLDAIRSDSPQVESARRRTAAAARQDLVVAEFATRFRERRGIAANATMDTPIMVVLAKADLWAGDLLDDDLRREPFRPETAGRTELDDGRIEAIAQESAELVRRFMPETAAVLERLSTRTFHVPHSALGASPDSIGDAVRPRWAALPMLQAIRLAEGSEA